MGPSCLLDGWLCGASALCGYVDGTSCRVATPTPRASRARTPPVGTLPYLQGLAASRSCLAQRSFSALAMYQGPCWVGSILSTGHPVCQPLMGNLLNSYRDRGGKGEHHRVVPLPWGEGWGLALGLRKMIPIKYCELTMNMSI